MKSAGCGSVMVFSGNLPVGIFTEKDYLKLNSSDAAQTKVEALMTKNVITGSASLSVLDAMHLLANNRIRHLPIAGFIGDDIDQQR